MLENAASTQIAAVAGTSLAESKRLCFSLSKFLLLYPSVNGFIDMLLIDHYNLNLAATVVRSGLALLFLETISLE